MISKRLDTAAPHVKNYYRHFGYDESDTILCECCGAPAVDIHHIEPRSSFGSKRKRDQDDPGNLIALCRMHHDMAHGKDSRLWKIAFKKLVSESFTRFDRATN